MTAQQKIMDVLRRFASNETDHETIVRGVLQEVGRHDEQFVAGLIKALGDDEVQVRRLAVTLFNELGPHDSALPALICALNDADRLVRIGAVFAVKRFNSKAKDAVPALFVWLKSDNDYSRVLAAEAITLIDQLQIEAMVPVLIRSLQSRDNVVRSTAAESLAVVGPLANRALPDLHRALNDEAESVRCRAAEAIWRITGDLEPAVTLGAKLLDDPDELNQALGVEFLCGLGNPVRAAE